MYGQRRQKWGGYYKSGYKVMGRIPEKAGEVGAVPGLPGESYSEVSWGRPQLSLGLCWANGLGEVGPVGVACPVLLALSSSHPHTPPVPIPAGIQPLRPWLCQQLVFNNLCTAGTQVSWQTRGLSSGPWGWWGVVKMGHLPWPLSIAPRPLHSLFSFLWSFLRDIVEPLGASALPCLCEFLSQEMG